MSAARTWSGSVEPGQRTDRHDAATGEREGDPILQRRVGAEKQRIDAS
jgi:hypothetical protein